MTLANCEDLEVHLAKVPEQWGETYAVIFIKISQGSNKFIYFNLATSDILLETSII